MAVSERAARRVNPGRIIQRELDARGWSQSDLAEIMGCSEPTVSNIINASEQITPELAQRLALAFGTSAELWLNLERNYRPRTQEVSGDV